MERAEGAQSIFIYFLVEPCSSLHSAPTSSVNAAEALPRAHRHGKRLILCSPSRKLMSQKMSSPTSRGWFEAVRSSLGTRRSPL